MLNPARGAYDALARRFARLAAVEDALGILHWDAQTMMAPGAEAGRSDQLATLEAIAFEVRDVLELLPDVRTLRVDGGAAANDLLLQLQADVLSMPVERPAVLETTGLGAAFLAGLGCGTWSSTEELASTWRAGRRFDPQERSPEATTYATWRRAVDRSKGWASA